MEKLKLDQRAYDILVGRFTDAILFSRLMELSGYAKALDIATELAPVAVNAIAVLTK
jgi:hypothetical protein